MSRNSRLRSAPLFAILGSQFLSALGDNALIFTAIAVVQREAYPAWAGPLLQEFFIVTYIILAPFVGHFADMQPKGRVMMLANVLKCAGAAVILFRLNPFLGYAIVGAGAAIYSPAKYGIVTELVSTQQLVKANGLIESTTIAAILLGAVMGGVLTDWSIQGALTLIAAVYACSAITALTMVPKLRPSKPAEHFAVLASIRSFAAQTAAFVRAPALRVSLIGTGVFWGSGAALRFLVIAWVPVQLQIKGSAMPGYLTGMVASGVAVGALLAGRFIKTESATRAIPAGIVLGVAVTLLPLVKTLPAAFALMALVGVSSGFFVVPLDALLQQKGAKRGGIGSTIAIQNLFENLSMIVMLGAYTVVISTKMHINTISVCFGILITFTMSLLLIKRKGH